MSVKDCRPYRYDVLDRVSGCFKPLQCLVGFNEVNRRPGVYVGRLPSCGHWERVAGYIALSHNVWFIIVYVCMTTKKQQKKKKPAWSCTIKVTVSTKCAFNTSRWLSWRSLLSVWNFFFSLCHFQLHYCCCPCYDDDDDYWLCLISHSQWFL